MALVIILLQSTLKQTVPADDLPHDNEVLKTGKQNSVNKINQRYT